MSLINFWLSRQSELATMLEQHVLLVVLSMTAAIAIGVPGGVLAAHSARFGKPVVAFANIAQTIPSLALLGFLLPVPIIGGVGKRASVAGVGSRRPRLRTATTARVQPAM